jgi:hypothetical protein
MASEVKGSGNKPRRIFLIGVLSGVVITAAVTFVFAIPANTYHWQMEIGNAVGSLGLRQEWPSHLTTVEPLSTPPRRKPLRRPLLNPRIERLYLAQHHPVQWNAMNAVISLRPPSSGTLSTGRRFATVNSLAEVCRGRAALSEAERELRGVNKLIGAPGLLARLNQAKLFQAVGNSTKLRV